MSDRNEAPKRVTGLGREEFLGVRIAPEVKAAIDEIAKCQRMSASDFARRAIIRELRGFGVDV